MGRISRSYLSSLAGQKIVAFNRRRQTLSCRLRRRESPTLDPRRRKRPSTHWASFRLRLGRQRVLGPRVLRIPRFEVLANLKIGRRPETAQVLRDLDGTVVRTEQVQHDGYHAPEDAGCISPSEHLLQPHGRKRAAQR